MRAIAIVAARSNDQPRACGSGLKSPLRSDQKSSIATDGWPLVEIWTDGGCKPNPGPGGWGALLRFGGVEKELSGGHPATTNNRMELTAAAEALQALTRPCRVRLYTDSEYLKNGITRWSSGWVRSNWRSSTGDPVKNMDLWRRVLDASRPHDVEWFWVRGHSGIGHNEKVDRLATAARQAATAMGSD